LLIIFDLSREGFIVKSLLVTKQMDQQEIVINDKTYKASQVIKYDIEEMKEKNIYDDMRNANYKVVSFDFEEVPDRKVVLLQDFKYGKGGIFWDGSYLLVKYFLSLETSWKNRETSDPSKIRILELGAGTALPTIVTGLLGYTAVATDLPSLVPFAEKNIYENLERGKNVEVKRLEWGNEEHMKEIPQGFDYIVAAELVYYEEHFDALIATLKHYCTEKTKIVMTHRIRLPERTELFLSKFKESFDFTYVDHSFVKKTIPNPNMIILVATVKSTNN